MPYILLLLTYQVNPVPEKCPETFGTTTPEKGFFPDGAGSFSAPAPEMTTFQVAALDWKERKKMAGRLLGSVRRLCGFFGSRQFVEEEQGATSAVSP